ncbi:MAG: hypothetical protein LBP87_13310 [Planctomycetaceae bacterium]|jgi:hypothetical protein|nr:hypothetical protein [Planctomycetaceae bacterium]
MKEFPSPIEIFCYRQTIQWLLVSVILLPIGMIFLFTFGRFFAMFGDLVAATIFDWLALGLGFFWFLSLVSLLMCVALQLLKNNNNDE